MKNAKRLLALGLTAAALTGTALGAGFVKSKTYNAGEFTDVPDDAWYKEEVASTYELGLMNGIGGGLFAPDGNVTIAEAITMASRANAIYAGATIGSAQEGEEWFVPYVKYATSMGFIKDGQFDDYNRPAKRYEVAKLFEDAMPMGYYTAQNSVSDIPDVSEKKDYKADLLTLYKAGVVMGSDSYGNFFPENNITRAEAAAIINRVAIPENRLKKTLDVYSPDNAYLLVYNDSFNSIGGKGINSGWALDNRGGSPRTDIYATYGSIADVSSEYGSAMIREFNNTTTGLIQLESTFTVSLNSDGVYMDFRNKDGNPVYRLEAQDGYWTHLNADGSKTPVYEIGEDETVFKFQIFVDLDNNRARAVINGKDTGTYPLATKGAQTNIQNYRYGTNEESTGVIRGTSMVMTVNYALYDMSNYSLKPGESHAQTFTPVSGIAVAEDSFYIENQPPFEYYFMSGAKPVAVLSYNGEDLYVNGNKVYEDLVNTVWYRFRLEMDTDNQNIIVRINGRIVKEVPFANAATSIDNYIAVNKSDKFNFSVGEMHIFEKKIAEDYVPVPVKPAGEEKYNVGINICSLWRNGMHYGWTLISPFDDIKPVLGYYDEGNPETADWEIKYMVEHGIDYQAFCWFSGRNTTPIGTFSNYYHLHDGYMNAEYSDMMKYCLIWEAANGAKPQTLEQWKKFYVPCFIEHYFKDPRYMTIDNQLLLYVFTPDKVFKSEGFGSTAVCKEAFDYLEEEVRKIGFDGVIFIGSNGSSSEELKAAGFDATSAYNWGTDSTFEANKTRNLNNAKDKSVYTIPTIATGFNNIGWSDGVRTPVMTAEDMKLSTTWARDEYVPEYAEEGTWQENLFMIATWNEYGEGTYIMPCEGLNGFGYLDALREVFTDEKADKSLNTIPTENQLKRINRMYPQHKRLLRKNGEYKEPVEEIDISKYKSVIEVKPGTHAGGINAAGIDNFAKNSDGTISGVTKSPDNYLAFGNGNSLDLSTANLVKITAKIPVGKTMRLYFTTVDDQSWAEGKAVNTTVSTTDDFAEYYFDFSKNKNWKGTLLWYRLDVSSATGDEFVIKSIDFMGTAAKPAEQQTKMFVNGKELEMKLPPSKAPNGDYVIAYDLTLGLEFLFNTYCVWDDANESLTIEGCGHTVKYIVGKDYYYVDGKEKKLGYTMYTFDGLPMIPLKKFCADMDFEFEMTEKGPSVITTEKTEKAEFYEAKESRVPYSWEFNVNGDTEGFSSGSMTLLTSDGYMSCQSNSTTYKDPQMNISFTPFEADKYTVLKFRVRYEYQPEIVDVKDEDGNPTGEKEERFESLTLYFASTTAGGLSEGKTIKIRLNSNSSNGEWEEYEYVIDHKDWSGKITTLRFDPFNAVGKIDIDYMRLERDPEYEAKQEALKVFQIVNGDAEGEKVGFISHNASVSIVMDPINGDDKCYLFMPKDNSKQWIYAIQDVYFTPGATYKISYDIAFASLGTNDAILAGTKKGSAMANLQYSDPNGTNHNVASTSKVFEAGGGWIHCEGTHTISASRELDGTQQRFTIYANPAEEMGVGFYLDNVVVEEIKPAEGKK